MYSSLLVDLALCYNQAVSGTIIMRFSLAIENPSGEKFLALLNSCIAR
ncbi:MAG: hypothetical protein J7M18_02305 [Candidatus Eremiobacteraeota bacterium]|nr:hypothetical protein [Candidatus Eremiobacteraeota bacterium]